MSISTAEKNLYGKNPFKKQRAETKSLVCSRAKFEQTYWTKPYKVIVGSDSFGYYYQVIKIEPTNRRKPKTKSQLI